ncbi:MAG: haloacid dehalogenase type II [Candidatus Dadabacteria bacterium]
MTKDAPRIKALTFDVFGTVVDWRSSVIRECEALGERRGVTRDWARFADEWRGGYAPAMDRVRKGGLPWTNIDTLHRMVLDRLLTEFEIDGLTEEEKDDLNRAWHRLSPWPDSIRGIERLRTRYVVATLSNGNVSLLVDMAKNAGIVWDCVLSSELAGHYKPDREVYLTAASLLGLRPGEIMMAAAHRDDLEAARSFGLGTAFISRPLEFGLEGKPDTASEGEFDIVAENIIDLAEKLGA